MDNCVDARSASEKTEHDEINNPAAFNPYYANSERIARAVGRSESHLGIGRSAEDMCGDDEDIPLARRRFLASRHRPAPLDTEGGGGSRSRGGRRTPLSTPSSGRMGSGDKMFTNINTGKSVVEMNARPVDIIPLEDLEPVANPAGELRGAFTSIQSSDWAKQLEGLNCLRAISIHHPEVRCLECRC